jgi:hypothetical protein
VSLATTVSVVLFAVLIGWLALVLAATWNRLGDDISAESGRRPRIRSELVLLPDLRSLRQVEDELR